MVHQRTRISTTDETYDEPNHYTPSSRQQSQSTIQINNNEVKKSFIVNNQVKFLYRKLALVVFRINHYYQRLVIKFNMNFSWVY
jgi:hypothetical protein